MILKYQSKKELKTCIGQHLKYSETSMFGLEYVTDGTITGSNRPHLTGYKQEFFACVTMKDGLIAKVS